MTHDERIALLSRTYAAYVRAQVNSENTPAYFTKDGVEYVNVDGLEAAGIAVDASLEEWEDALNQHGPWMLARLERQQARVAELEDALKPFADSDWGGDVYKDSVTVDGLDTGITVGDCRWAATVLKRE